MLDHHLTSEELKAFLRANAKQHNGGTHEEFEKHVIALFNDYHKVVKEGFTWQINGAMLVVVNP